MRSERSGSVVTQLALPFLLLRFLFVIAILAIINIPWSFSQLMVIKQVLDSTLFSLRMNIYQEWLTIVTRDDEFLCYQYAHWKLITKFIWIRIRQLEQVIKTVTKSIQQWVLLEIPEGSFDLRLARIETLKRQGFQYTSRRSSLLQHLRNKQLQLTQFLALLTSLSSPAVISFLILSLTCADLLSAFIADLLNGIYHIWKNITVIIWKSFVHVITPSRKHAGKIIKK